MSKLVPHTPEMRVDEIARKLGITENMVKKALKKGMKKLRDGRAIPIKDLQAARDRFRREPHKIVEGCIC